jgi:hypothetical protein
MTLRYEPAAKVRHHHRTDMDGLARQLDDAAHGYPTYLDKLSAGRTVSRTSAALFRARWYAWLVARVILGTFGLKDVPSQLLRSQLRAAWAVRQGSRGERNMFRTTEADRSAPAGAQ